MHKKVALLLLCAALLCSHGCGQKTRYSILSFFFDGVPAPKESSAGKTGNRDGVQSTTEGKKKPRYYTHGPYEAGLCGACHDSRTNTLIQKKEALCSHCHVLSMKGETVHGPLASGGCMVCHDPHGSVNEHLLVSDAKDFCLFCHDEKDIRRQAAHGGTVGDCTACHDAHSSTNRYLLK